MNKTIRMRFSKTGRAKYISHLDLIRCIQRAVVRAGLPAAYSEGFHPHMQTAFATTLSLGFTSTAEILDLTLTEELPASQVMARLNQALPEGIHMEEAGEPTCAYRDLAFADYRVEIPCDDPVSLAADFEALAAQTEILTEKKTKKGIKEVDIRPMMEVQDVQISADMLTLFLRLASGNSGSLNPSLVTNVLLKQSEVSAKMPVFCRTALLTAEKSKFF